MSEVEGVLASRDFWVGASSSIVGGLILVIIAYIFRNALSLTKARRERTRQENEIFDNALKTSSAYSPFAYGIVQARALRYFLLAVFVAYIGDILDIFWPANSAIYILSLFFILQGLKWFYKIEQSAMAILTKGGEQ